MTDSIKKYITAVLLTALFLCTGAESRKELNSILASVNGIPISQQDVLPLTRAEEFKIFSTYTGKELQKRILAVRRKAVDELIDRKLILEDYAGKNFELANRDIESALDDLAERSGLRSRSEFRETLRRQGEDIEQVRKQVRESMIVQLMLHREFLAFKSITPEKMHALFLEKQKTAKDDCEIELAMLLLDKKNSFRSGMIAEELQKKTENFPNLAREWSSGPGREEGGKLGKIQYSLLRPEFAKAIGKPEVNKICGPITTPEGTVFLKVLFFSSPNRKSFKESIPELRKQLEEEQRRKSKKIYTQRLRKNAVIRYFFQAQDE